MNIRFLGITLLTATTLANPAFATPLDEVTVHGPGPEIRQAGRSYTGIPIEKISLSVRVNTADLNLETPSGQNEARKRIHVAAVSACAEISRLYPLSEPGNEPCAAAAERAAVTHLPAA